MEPREIYALIEDAEGRVGHLYRCSAGHVTAGVGRLVATVQDALSMPLEPREAIVSDFEIVSRAPAGYLPRYYAGITRARMSDAAMDALLEQDVRRFLDGLRAQLPFFDALPGPVQLAVCDMAFNLGLAGFSKYLNLINALRSRDWLRAATECHRRGIGDERNQRTAALFLSCAAIDNERTPAHA